MENKIPLKTAKILSLPGILHGFFGRQGGVSKGVYSSLNIGLNKGDDEAHIIENRKRISEVFGGLSLMTLRQVHKNEVLIVDASTEKGHQKDAMVTKIPGRLMAIQTADCAPVLLADPLMRVVGAVHAGWRGAVTGIIKNTLEAMYLLGAKGENIRAAIGPCVYQASYEVGQEVYDEAKQPDFFVPSTKSGHYFFDLNGYVCRNLNEQGVNAIEVLPFDTYALEQEYFSCRRSTHCGEHAYGTQLSVIGLM